LLLSGCNWVLMNPSGDVAMQQRDLISTGLMLLIIVPVIALTLLFCMALPQGQREADYARTGTIPPSWSW
jgi:cytochrome o ubiquinol oxidase subunit 2